jgi:hypothetical protein
MLGPGKYDDICQEVARKVGINHDTGGGVIIAVLGGNRGNGFSVHADIMTMMQIPDILEIMVKQLRKDSATLTKEAGHG